MRLSFRKLVAVALGVGALALAGGGQAKAGILLVLTDNGAVIGSNFSAGNVATVTGVSGPGFTSVSASATTNFPGAGIGNLITSVVAQTAATGPIGQIVATAYVVNSNNPNDLATFTSPAGTNLFLNNQLTATGGTSGFVVLTSLGFGKGTVTSNATVRSDLTLPASNTTTGKSFSGDAGFALFNQVVIDSPSNGSTISAVGTSTVSNPLAVPEPGTMAAALTGLLFVGGLGLRRRSK